MLHNTQLYTYPSPCFDPIISRLYILQGVCDLRVLTESFKISHSLSKLVYKSLVIVYITRYQLKNTQKELFKSDIDHTGKAMQNSRTLQGPVWIFPSFLDLKTYFQEKSWYSSVYEQLYLHFQCKPLMNR